MKNSKERVRKHRFRKAEEKYNEVARLYGRPILEELIRNVEKLDAEIKAKEELEFCASKERSLDFNADFHKPTNNFTENNTVLRRSSRLINHGHVIPLEFRKLSKEERLNLRSNQKNTMSKVTNRRKKIRKKIVAENGREFEVGNLDESDCLKNKVRKSVRLSNRGPVVPFEFRKRSRKKDGKTRVVRRNLANNFV